MAYETDFLISLFITVFIETIVLFILNGTLFHESKIKSSLIILAGITASCATLPYLWFIFPLFLRTRLLYTILSEGFAIVAETFILQGFFRIRLKHAALLSLIANLVSYGCGLIIQLF